MAEGIPRATLRRAEQEGRLREALEFCLRRSDVARILGADSSSVLRWTRTGRRGWILPSWKTGTGKSAPILFRLYDVKKFAERAGLRFRVEMIPLQHRAVFEASRGPLD